MPSPIDRHQLLAELRSPHPPVLVEALGPAYFLDAHLPGAVNLPPAHVDRLARQLVPDAGTAIVVYCRRGGAGAWLVGRRLEELGYADVRIYAAGKEDWAEHGLPFERAAE